eukprot:1111753-Alexandrium_andersonii.AAC.1
MRQPGRMPVGRHTGAVSSSSGQCLVSLCGQYHTAHAGCSAGVCGREQLAAPRSAPGSVGGRPLESELE